MGNLVLIFCFAAAIASGFAAIISAVVVVDKYRLLDLECVVEECEDGLRCSNCGGTFAANGARYCPHCRARILNEDEGMDKPRHLIKES